MQILEANSQSWARVQIKVKRKGSRSRWVTLLMLSPSKVTSLASDVTVTEDPYSPQEFWEVSTGPDM